LPEQCLKLHGLSRIELAMDPFTGLGSTAVACARLGLNFVGSDLDETYLAEAVERTREAIQPRQNLPERGSARMRKAGLGRDTAAGSRDGLRESGIGRRASR
jgi:site-specific DNA-methyltransferase (adenine-specific)